MSSLLYKQAVEQDMVAGILADAYQFSEDDLRRRRAESISNVKKTNGRISLDQRVRKAWEEGMSGRTDRQEFLLQVRRERHPQRLPALHRHPAPCGAAGLRQRQGVAGLLRAHRNDIAAAINIPPNDFRWYAAFHDEGDHSHVHMMAWSAKPGQAYLSKEGIRQIKSELANDIFKQELLRLYEQKSVSRDELVHEARKAMLELVQVMKAGICDHPDAEQLMLELAMQLSGQGQEVLWISPKVTEETGGSDRG